jgi:hypothetical protein
VLRAYILDDLAWGEELFNNVCVSIVLRPFVLRLFVLTPFTRPLSVSPLLTGYFWWGVSFFAYAYFICAHFFTNKGRKMRYFFTLMSRLP